MDDHITMTLPVGAGNTNKVLVSGRKAIKRDGFKYMVTVFPPVPSEVYLEIIKRFSKR